MAKAEIGLVGLGTMGSALALNIADKGHSVAVWNRTHSHTEAFVQEAGPLAERIVPAETHADLVAALAEPRAIILMVPAGAPVDEQIAALRPLLGPDDLIIDAGNANFRDTSRRATDSGGPFLGIGVSGGEEGARHGPSIMGGGERAYWDRVAHILKDIAADYEGTPCATWMGEKGAGHFVKAVHNGIEYADMQMIAETYGILRDGMGMGYDAIADVFAKWNDGPLASYLIEISAKVAAATDARTGEPLLTVIADSAGQKGTGRWTAVEAQHLGAAIPAIEAAVAARNLSAKADMRATGEELFGAGPQPMGPNAPSLDSLEQALMAGKIMCYAQGFAMINAASDEFGWALPLPEIARVWRAGCIIRSAMLNDMADALAEDPARNLLFAPFFADKVRAAAPALREVVIAAQAAGIAVPALASGLAWFDTVRTARGTADMIQGQRDFFGLHGFVRRDTGESGQHGPWAS
ncbi:NADP-dependent phosphogluconate dehydrogenase [Wenxinia marina]|uniref:6-phosphogluconate dehydrogenase, decarboxylating n=1 Tax=Wenxinia marina DSM 24838 TaxID=1123501 RepID=A0A0D0PYA4_9RHOB|nr:NADP-dependent phosphogluconate dehydrogenase [Wenxinia marina]KIQ67409.1 6-phosphogluconate dehydrogenase (decarboxylating) [Wenxinia marina DSM 24838]GGL69719.1 6-phosphogluconate dehydrogenase, decarboxylating [Wenxinia marina]